MRGVVPDQLQRARIVAGEELDPGVFVMGSARSATVPSSTIATVRLASEGEMPLAMSRPVELSGYSRRAPSGKGQRDHDALLLLTRCYERR